MRGKMSFASFYAVIDVRSEKSLTEDGSIDRKRFNDRRKCKQSEVIKETEVKRNKNSLGFYYDKLRNSLQSKQEEEESNRITVEEIA